MDKLKPLLLITLLAGCATATKPALPEHEYTALPRAMAAIEKCGQTDLIPIDLVAWGRSYSGNFLSRHTYDAQRIQQSYTGFEQSINPSAADCKELHTQLLMRKQREDKAVVTRSQQQEEPSVFTPTRRTHCNKIGTQTFCTTN